MLPGLNNTKSDFTAFRRVLMFCSLLSTNKVFMAGALSQQVTGLHIITFHFVHADMCVKCCTAAIFMCTLDSREVPGG